jgi:transcriptional regulator with XRE-family HTH domain
LYILYNRTAKVGQHRELALFKEVRVPRGRENTMAMAFGEYFRELRARLNLPLRQFCIANGYDPGNISKLERGLLPPPPTADEKLRDYARALKLKKGSEAWITFFDLAALARREIPEDIMSDEDLVGRLPLVFRTLRGQKVNDEQLDSLVDKIRKS